MYPVSDAYRRSVKQQIINGCSAELTLYNVNQYAQSTMSLGFDDAIWGSERYPEYRKMLRIPTPPVDKIATLEEKYMTADGSFALYDRQKPPWYYISTAMSTSVIDDNEEYPISGCKIRLYGSAEKNAGACTLLVDGIKRVKATTTDGFTQQEYEYTVQGDKMFIECLSPDSNYPVTITVLALDRPNIRARIYGVYVGAPPGLESWSGEDILSVEYKGVNDTVCLDLPARNLVVTVRNQYGISQEQDIDSPRYTRLHTQAGLNYLYDLSGNQTYETVPTGRWFLDTYRVTRDTITLSFFDAIGLLNEFINYWCELGKVPLSDRIDEVRKIIDRADIYQAGIKLRKTPAELFGIVINDDLLNNAALSVGAAPLQSYATSLQLYANISDNRLSYDRNNGCDISLSPYDLIGTPVMTLERDERYGELEIVADDAFQTAVVTENKLSAESKEQTVATDEWIGYTDTLYTLNGQFGGLLLPNESQVYITPFAWCFYISCRGAAFTADKLTVSVKGIETKKKDVAVMSGDGKTQLNNPLVDGEAITATDYVSSVGSVLKYNVHYKINHRGYPELDEGDIILVETEPGIFARCLIEENEWSIKSGVKSGSTKVRRLK